MRDHSPLNMLSNKAILITHASTKLGYSIAQRLGFSGAKLFIADSNDQKLRKSVHDLKELGLEVAGAVVDVTVKDQRQKLFDEVQKKYQQIDAVIVNNPVNSLRGEICTATKMQFDDMYSKYLTQPFKICREALPLLSQSSNGGSIVLMSSFCGFSPFEEIGLFSAAQTALLGLCKAAAIDFAKKNVRVNSVSLGMMRDDSSGAFWSVNEDEDRLAQLSQMIPLGRVPKNTECTAVVEFLVSDRARYITAENVLVNGGIQFRI